MVGGLGWADLGFEEVSNIKFLAHYGEYTGSTDSTARTYTPPQVTDLSVQGLFNFEPNKPNLKALRTASNCPSLASEDSAPV